MRTNPKYAYSILVMCNGTIKGFGRHLLEMKAKGQSIQEISIRKSALIMVYKARKVCN